MEPKNESKMESTRYKWNPGDLIIFGSKKDDLLGFHFMKNSTDSYFSVSYYKGKIVCRGPLWVGGDLSSSAFLMKVIKINESQNGVQNEYET